jgi:hypothetical protein
MAGDNSKIEIMTGWFKFWYSWLLISSIVIVVMGLTIALFSDTAIFKILFNNHINKVFWNYNIQPGNFVEFQKWIYGVLGAVMAGWGVIIFYLILRPFKELQAWAWECLLIGITVWYMIDTLISFHYHVIFNVIFNSILLLLILLPLAFTKKQFVSTRKTE